MPFETIQLDFADDVATLTLNRPDVMNGLSVVMRAEITEAMVEAGKNARVVVLTGAGRGFCSGQDLSGTSDIDTLDLAEILRREYEPMLHAICDCPVPTIAAVNGPAAGAGANLALACDVVIATESAFFIQAFSLIGLIPDAGGTYWLPRQIGSARAMGAALFAERISAKQAADWGMIWEAVADDEFGEVVAQRAAHLAKGPTLAYQGIKQALRTSSENSFGAQLALEAELQGQMGRSADFKEGVAAFLEKRSPKFTGK